MLLASKSDVLNNMCNAKVGPHCLLSVASVYFYFVDISFKVMPYRT